MRGPAMESGGVRRCVSDKMNTLDGLSLLAGCKRTRRDILQTSETLPSKEESFVILENHRKLGGSQNDAELLKTLLAPVKDRED